MLTAESIKQLLDIHSIPYTLVEHEHYNSLSRQAEEQGFSLESTVRLVHFEHADDHFITLVPVTQVLDIEQLQNQLILDAAPTLSKNSGQTASDETLINNFPQTTLIFDKSLENIFEIIIPLSPDDSFIKLSDSHLNQLREKSRILDFSVAVEDILNSDFSDGLNFRKKRIIDKIMSGDLSEKPGFVRVSLHPTMTNEELDVIINAVKVIAENYQEWGKDYLYDSHHNEFHHKDEIDKSGTIEDWFSF